eukprot:TRINITY_DN4226_c0_g1_i1.p1 TRINITY_DN4226_c0_g1~~TRINITY_DN4226_c0_g1_i1.p1  ORF type:complete len:194 (+),score=2.96 TRINITY_DN4226_c0_g1_i1:58-639(+)
MGQCSFKMVEISECSHGCPSGCFCEENTDAAYAWPRCQCGTRNAVIAWALMSVAVLTALAVFCARASRRSSARGTNGVSAKALMVWRVVVAVAVVGIFGGVVAEHKKGPADGYCPLLTLWYLGGPVLLLIVGYGSGCVLGCFACCASALTTTDIDVSPADVEQLQETQEGDATETLLDSHGVGSAVGCAADEP